jgi:hypothetical protein
MSMDDKIEKNALSFAERMIKWARRREVKKQNRPDRLAEIDQAMAEVRKDRLKAEAKLAKRKARRAASAAEAAAVAAADAQAAAVAAKAAAKAMKKSGGVPASPADVDDVVITEPEEPITDDVSDLEVAVEDRSDDANRPVEHVAADEHR